MASILLGDFIDCAIISTRIQFMRLKMDLSVCESVILKDAMGIMVNHTCAVAYFTYTSCVCVHPLILLLLLIYYLLVISSLVSSWLVIVV